MAVTINGTTGIDKVQDDSVDIADLSATGTASSSTYLRGDNTWATVTSGATSIDGLSDCTVTADDNIGIGSTAVDSITTGDQNVGVGVYALTATTTGSHNSGFGHQALYANSTGSQNTAVGRNALENNTTANDNVAVGYYALKANSTGSQNVSVGTNAMQTNTTGTDNVAVGVYALATNADGHNNVAIGRLAMQLNTSGTHNVGIGQEALKANTSAGYNTAVGRQAMTANTTGNSCTAVGYQAGNTNTTGTKNVAIGMEAGRTTTASYTTCVGWKAGNSLGIGGSNTLIGAQAGASLAGAGAGGVNNVLIGYQAGYDATAYTGARWNVIVGDFCRGSSGNAQAEIVMGYNVASGSENRFTFGLGTSDSAINFGATSITAPSDERLKEDITTSTAGLSFIKDLRPVTYKWRQEKDIPDTMQAHVAGSTTRFCNDKTNHGFVAQEVKTAIDAHPEIKDGFEMWDTDVQDGRQRIADGALVPILVKAIQELSAKNDALEARITTLEG